MPPRRAWLAGLAVLGAAPALAVRHEPLEFTGRVEDSYPRAALAAGIDGDASLTCRQEADGRLTGCELYSEGPDDRGFGRAALTLLARPDRYRAAPTASAGRESVTVVFQHAPRAIVLRANRLHDELTGADAVTLARSRGVSRPESIVLARRGQAWQPGEWNTFYRTGAPMPGSGLCAGPTFHVWGGFGERARSDADPVWDAPTEQRLYALASSGCPTDPDRYFAAPSDEAATGAVALLARIKRVVGRGANVAQCGKTSAAPSTGWCTRPVAAIRSLRIGDLTSVALPGVGTVLTFQTRELPKTASDWYGRKGVWRLTVTEDDRHLVAVLDRIVPGFT